MRKILSLLPVMALCVTLAYGQARVYNGKVTDEAGSPIPFATILIKGSKTGTSADVEGRFTIKAKSGDVLRVSAQGVETKEFTVGAEAVINIPLKKGNSTLQEVVVTGAFGIKRAQRVTPYSTQVIGEQQLNIVPQSDLNDAMAGKVAGAQYRAQSSAKLNSEGSFRIRGGLMLTGDIGPLYVVDGTPTNSFDINPNDVEDITVLKGANATALFGEGAKGGAIVVTTKKGLSKGNNVEVNQSFTLDKVYILPKFQNLYAGGAAADLQKFTWAPGMPDAWKPLDGKYFPDYTDDASWGPRMVGQEYVPWYSWIPGHSLSGTTAKLVAQPDNVKDFWSTGLTNNTNIAVGKNGPGLNYRLSYTNNTIQGIIPDSKMYRNTLNGTVNSELNNHFSIGLNITYTNQYIRGDFNDAYANQSSGSFSSWFHRDLDMNLLKKFRGLKTPTGTYASWNMGANPSAGNAAASWKGNYWYNYYTWDDLLDNEQKRDKMYGDVSLTYQLNRHFKVRGTIRKNAISTTYENTTPSELEASGSQTGVLASFASGTTYSNTMDYEFLASWNQTFLGKLNVSVNAGANDDHFFYRDDQAATSKGLNVPGLYAIANSKQQPTITNTRQQSETHSVFGSGDIEWNKMVDISFALRNDWYSTLLPGANSLLSPSVGGSFFFSDFTKSAMPWLSFGKVFLSWGKKPTSLGVFNTNFLYSVNQNQWAYKNANYFLMTTPNGTVSSTIAGALITTYEGGLDMRFINNKYGLNITYYEETSKDAPLSVALAGYSGFSSILTNTSLVKRRGLEFQFDAKPITTKNFSWQVTKTFSYLISDVVEKTDNANNDILIASGAAFSGIVPPKVYQSYGKEWGQLRGTTITRSASGQAVLDPVTGAYVTTQNAYLGSVVPKYNGGLVNTFMYKNFILNFSLDYQIGGKFFSLSEMWGTYSGLLATTATTNDKGWNVRDDVSVGGGVHVKGVSAADQKTPVDMYVDGYTYFHNLAGSNAISDPFLHSLTYVKLRQLSVGYMLPVGKMGLAKVFKSAQATLIAKNPVIIYRETKNFDPSEISNVQGEDGQLPGTRSLGIDLKFAF